MCAANGKRYGHWTSVVLSVMDANAAEGHLQYSSSLDGAMVPAISRLPVTGMSNRAGNLLLVQLSGCGSTTQSTFFVLIQTKNIMIDER